MNHDAPGAGPVDDFSFLPPAVSPRRREPEPFVADAEELPAPFLSHGGGPSERRSEPVGGDEMLLEELDVLASAEESEDDFPWLLPEPASAPASSEGGEGISWIEVTPDAAEEPEESFPWDVPASASPEGFGWEGEPSIGSEEAVLPLSDEPVAEGWDDRWEGAGAEPEFRAAAFVWDEEGEEVEPLTAEAPQEPGVGAGWEWSDGLDEPAEEPSADRWAQEPAVEAAWGGEAEADAAADPFQDVAERLERIARALRSGSPAEALQQGDPLQLLITGYALGYAEARKAKGE